jgi:hypothetical protein
VGSYGNGLRLAVTVAGRVDPSCPRPKDSTYWIRGPELVLHWCAAVGT